MLYDWSQEGMILGLYMGNSLRLYGKSLPDVFLPSRFKIPIGATGGKRIEKPPFCPTKLEQKSKSDS